ERRGGACLAAAPHRPPSFAASGIRSQGSEALDLSGCLPAPRRLFRAIRNGSSAAAAGGGANTRAPPPPPVRGPRGQQMNIQFESPRGDRSEWVGGAVRPNGAAAGRARRR